MSITDEKEDTPMATPDTPAVEAAASAEEEDKEVEELLDELKEPSENEEAVNKLKESTSKLTNTIGHIAADIDSKFKIMDKAKTVDAQVGVTSKVQGAATTVGGLLGQLKIGEKVNGVLNQGPVKHVTTEVGNLVNKSGIKDAVVNVGKEVQKVDEEHKVAAKALGAVSSGVDFVANTISNVASKDEKK